MAVGKFSWQRTPFKRTFAQHKVARLARRFATTRRIQRLSNHLFTVARILFKELQKSSVDRRLHNPLHFSGAELRLCLAFKLWIYELYGDDSRQPFAHIFTSEVWVVVFDRTILSAPVVKRARQRCAESGDVRSAINGVDVVCKREQCLRPRVALILECNFNTCCSIDALQIDRSIMGGLASAIQVANK